MVKGLYREASDSRNPLGCAFNGLSQEVPDSRNPLDSWSKIHGTEMIREPTLASGVTDWRNRENSRANSCERRDRLAESREIESKLFREARKIRVILLIRGQWLRIKRIRVILLIRSQRFVSDFAG